MNPLRGGTWNMLAGRDEDAAATSALALMRSRDLDFLCIQESRGYLDALRVWSGPPGEFRVIAFSDAVRGSDSESAIIVRADHPHGPGHQVKATSAGWFRADGSKTGPKYFTTVKFADGLRVASIHAAPSVRWRGGRVLGPVRRVISMREFARSVVRFAKAHPGPLVIAGDWNATPEARGRYSPHWIAAKAGLRIVATQKGTHGVAHRIDFALVRGCAATARREKRRGSDHFAVVFTIGR